MQPTVLVVDDQPLVLDVLKKILVHGNYQVLTATCADDALEILAKRKIDVVVSDERMPGMPGTVFLTLVKERYPEIARIILTGHANLDAAIRAINEGQIFRFLTKPCNSRQLLETVAAALQQSRPPGADRRFSLMETLEKQAPGITRVKRDSSGAVIIED